MDEDVVIGWARGARWQRVIHGVHRCPEPTESVSEAWTNDVRAISGSLPEYAAFTHLTAAALRGWAVPQVDPRSVPYFVTLPHPRPSIRRRGVVTLRSGSSTSTERPVRAVRDGGGGIALAPPAEVVLHCARDLGVLDLIAMIDSALRAGQVTRGDLSAIAGQGRPGGPMVRRALRWSDPRAESAYESYLRVQHRVFHTPVTPQRIVLDAEGRFVARGDLHLDGSRVLHEYDGGVHRDRAQHRRDLDRDRRLEAAGWVRRGYTAEEVVHRPELILADCDRTVGRRSQPALLEDWRGVLASSALTSSGRTRVLARLRR